MWRRKTKEVLGRSQRSGGDSTRPHIVLMVFSSYYCQRSATTIPHFLTIVWRVVLYLDGCKSTFGLTVGLQSVLLHVYILFYYTSTLCFTIRLHSVLLYIYILFYYTSTFCFTIRLHSVFLYVYVMFYYTSTFCFTIRLRYVFLYVYVMFLQ